MSLIIPQTNLYGGRALRSNPNRRSFEPGARMLSGSNAQPDQAQMWAAQEQNPPQNFRALPQVQSTLNNRTLPTQVCYTPFLIYIQAVKTPQLLIPRNPNRASYIIAINTNLTDTQFSFGWPIWINVGAAAGYIGLLLPDAANFQESNGSCSIDDIFAFTNTDGDVGYPVLAYEGVLAIESMQHQSARAK